jgi:hypothetical protein
MRQPLPAASNLFFRQTSRMASLHSTIRVGLLLVLLMAAKSILVQEKPHDACFEQPHGARDAIHRLPASFYYWLAEDAVFIISPEERCAFLHLNTDEEREQFIEHVILGPPDSVDLITDRVAPGAAPNQSADTQLHRTEKWCYHYMKGVGENVDFQFTYDARYGDYLFSESDRTLLGQATPDPTLFQNPKEKIM